MREGKEPAPRRLALAEYYLLEGINSFAATLFQLSLFFWTRSRLGFSHADNLWLGVTQGAVYIVFSRVGGSLSGRLGCMPTVLISASLTTLIPLVLMVSHRPFAPYLVMALYSSASALSWPGLESAIVHAPGRWSTPRRLAAYNMVWSLTGALGFFASGALFSWHANAVLFVPSLLHLTQVAWLLVRRSAAAPVPAAAPPPATAAAAAVRNKTRFMYAAWLGNTLGYFVVTGFSALAPHVGERLSLSPRLTIWLVCSMLFARAAAFVGFGWWEGWHYRWRWFVTALVLLPATLAVSFFSPSVGAVLAGQVVMGVALGLVYSASLYYSLDVGHGSGDHGGIHESMIGVGILAGPLAGVAGAWTGGVDGAQALILVVYALAGVSGMSAACLLPRRRNG